jgi:dihydrofolate reductase
MRKIILALQVSLDGFFEGPNGEIDWHMVDEELHSHFNEQLASMGAFLDGRVTYELMADFWPTADQDPSSTPAMVEFAKIWRDTVVRDVVADDVLELKAQPGGDLALGGADLADTFRRLGLIDEYWIYVHPVLIGRGNPLFKSADDRTALTLAGTRAFGNGVVLLRYAG